MASQTVVLKVGMSCGGCVGAVNRVLTNMEGVETFDIDLEQKKVTVNGNVEPDAVLLTVSKTGKKTEFWPTEASEPIKPVDAPTSEVEPPSSSEDAEAEETVEPTAAEAAPASEAQEPVKAVASA